MANSSHSHSDHDGHDHSKHDHSHGGSHDHDHSHVPTVTKDNERKILISFFIIFTFMIVEAVGGVISGSLALLADAGHMLTDAIALGLAYVAFRLGRRAADSQRTFGYARFEVIAGLVNALTLFGIVGFIVAVDAARRTERTVRRTLKLLITLAVSAAAIAAAVLAKCVRPIPQCSAR